MMQWNSPQTTLALTDRLARVKYDRSRLTQLVENASVDNLT